MMMVESRVTYKASNKLTIVVPFMAAAGSLDIFT